MVRIFINNVIVATVSAPIRTTGPVPHRYIYGNSTRQPEAVMVAVDSHDIGAVAQAKLIEASMRDGMIQMLALVIRTVMAVQ